MIFLCLVCLFRVGCAVDFDSGGVASVTPSNVRQIPKPMARADPKPRLGDPLDNRYVQSMTRIGRSTHRDRDESESKSIYFSPLRLYAQELVESAWVDPPIATYLTPVVIPGMVVTHGKVTDLGYKRLTAVNQQFSIGGEALTNLTIFHGNLKTTYKYNLDGPKGRLEVKAPSRIYSMTLSSKRKGSECITKISDLALEKEEDMEFTANGESSERVSDAYIKFLEHVLTSESRRTAYFNIWATMVKTLQTARPPFCQESY